jgi:hypothetical protein
MTRTWESTCSSLPKSGRTPAPARVQRSFAAGPPGSSKTPSSPPAREGSGPVPRESPSLRRPRRTVAFRRVAPPCRSAPTDRSSVPADPRRAADRSPTAVPVRGTATAVRPSSPRNRSTHRTASAAGGCVRAPGACLPRERPACAAFRTAAPLRPSVWATSSCARQALAGRCAPQRTPGTTNRPRGNHIEIRQWGHRQGPAWPSTSVRPVRLPRAQACPFR